MRRGPANVSLPLPVLEAQENGSLPVVATVFDKLNQVYKEYLEAEQSYTAVSSGTGGESETASLPLNTVLSSIGGGIGSDSRRRRSETARQDAGGHRPVGHVHARPVGVHGEEGTDGGGGGGPESRAGPVRIQQSSAGSGFTVEVQSKVTGSVPSAVRPTSWASACGSDPVQ